MVRFSKSLGERASKLGRLQRGYECGFAWGTKRAGVGQSKEYLDLSL